MHELFTAGVIPDEEVKGTLMILQGLCAMTPIRQLEWRLIFEGPRTQPLSGVGAQVQTRKPANLPLWKELNTQLSRQSYHLTVCHNIDDTIFGDAATGNVTEQPVAAASNTNIADREATLRFLDFPDPVGTRTVNSRMVINIKDEAQLPGFLAANRYRYSKDFVREGYYAYRDNTIFSLSRDYLKPKTDGEMAELHVPNSLPAFEQFTPFDPERKWVLTMSVEVADGNKPDLVKRAIDQLEQAKFDFAGICEFNMTPRQKLDTRVQLQR